MGVNHRRGHVRMAQQLLDGADVVAVFKQMGGEGMAKTMAARGFCDARPNSGILERALEDGFVQMVPAPFAREPVGVMAGRGKHPLPAPLLGSVGTMPATRMATTGN